MLQEFVKIPKPSPRINTFRTELTINFVVPETSTNGVDETISVKSANNQLSATGSHRPSHTVVSNAYIRSLHQNMGEATEMDDDNVINALGIVHPKTGEVLTVREAIRLHVLNVRTGRIATQPNSKSGWVTIEQAVEKGLMSKGLADKLSASCDIVGDHGGPQMTLLEAIQKQLSDAERGQWETDKVINEDHVDGFSDTLSASEIRCEVFQVLNKKITLDGEEMTVLDAVYQGNLGQINLTEDELLLLSRLDDLKPKNALKAILTKTLYALKIKEDVRNDVPSEGWNLFEAIERKLFDPISGVFITPGTNRLVSFKECINTCIINPDSAVVVDPNSSRTLTLKQALRENVLDDTGHFLEYTMKGAIKGNFVRVPSAVESHVSPVQTTEVKSGSRKVERSNSLQTPFFILDSITEKELNYVQNKNRRESFLPETLLESSASKTTLQEMTEKYICCDDMLSEYLIWIGEIEKKIANQDISLENLDQLRDQLIKEKIDCQFFCITICLDELHYIIATSSEFLSRDEINNLEKSREFLKSRYDHANERTNELRRLVSAEDVFSEFKFELTTLDEKELTLANANQLADTSSTGSISD